MSILQDDNPNQEELTLDPNKKYWEDLVGDGKRYKDPESIARSKVEGDHYIELLKRQKDELRDDNLKMRAELMAKASLEELYAKVDKKPDEHKSQPEQKPYDPAELEKLMSSKITESLNAYELSNRQKANENLVKERLIERFGSNYQKHVKQQIEQLGITEDLFNQMAQNYPQMVFKTLEVDKTPTQGFLAPPRTSGNYSPPVQHKRTWSYYQDLKKQNPKLYLDPKTTNQMQKDYMELGDAFEDGDFKLYG